MKRKPVHEITHEHLGDYLYYAQYQDRGKQFFLGCDSIKTLKEDVKDRQLRSCWITINEGCFSAGQHATYEWLYIPKYRRIKNESR
jgi:hypothetical protein